MYSHRGPQSLVRLNCLLLTLHPSPKCLQASWEVLPRRTVRGQSLISAFMLLLHTRFHRSVRGGTSLPVSQAHRKSCSPALQRVNPGAPHSLKTGQGQATISAIPGFLNLQGETQQRYDCSLWLSRKAFSFPARMALA